MKSKIYFGRVRHRRFSPKTNTFNYRIFMMYLDLDEIDHVFDKFWFWSNEKTNLASFFKRNYLTHQNKDIKASVREEIWEQKGVVHQGPIRMLTHLSYFGFCFNPVTFYYCFDESDEKLEFIVAQINNTPWDERHCYVIENTHADKTNQNKKDNPFIIEKHFAKEFHVSPFLPMDMNYHWRFNKRYDNLSVYMKNTKNNIKVFDVDLLLEEKPISSGNLAKALFSYPLLTWQVIFKIYWQALKLWLRKIPFYVNPKNQDINQINN